MKKYALPIIGVAVFAFAVYLGAIYGIAISFAFFSIIVATYFASRSLKLTSKSLELTRNTQRPFLSLSESIPVSMTEDMATMTFNIRNSGSLPAGDVHSEIDFFDEDEEVTEDNLSSKYLSPHRRSEYGLLFPNSTYYEKFQLDLKDKGDLELWQNIEEGKVKFRARIMYGGLETRHITIDTAQIVRIRGEEQLQILPISPQKWA